MRNIINSTNSMNQGLHLAVIGTGRVGRMTLMALAHQNWIGKLTLIDTAPGLAEAVGEEIRHSLASTRIPMEINSYQEDQAAKEADLVLVTAGIPRTPAMKDRVELTTANAEVIKEIAEAIVPKNPEARYVIVTNPVDTMATLFKKISSADWVISTGTNLESQRFRAELAKQLDIPITSVSGFAAGEHGKDAVFLWSTVTINGLPLTNYLQKSGKALEKEKLEESVKEISLKIVQASGGTRHGPATSFRDILRSIALDDNRILSVAAPYRTSKTPEPVMISLPQMVGKTLGPTFENNLDEREQNAITQAAQKIYKTYQTALHSIK